MKKMSICLTVVGILVLWSCAVMDVDRSADLAKYKTFAWGRSSLKVENPAYRSDLIASNIKDGIKSELTKKGITYSAKKPDMLVSYQGFTENRERGYVGGMSNYTYYYPFYTYQFFPYGGFMMGPLYWREPSGYYSYTRGTLVINFRDRKTGKLLWSGTVQGSVDNLKSLKKNVSKGVKAIMKKYPSVPPSLMPIPKDRVS